MRIISGEFGGRRLKVPQSSLVRPTTDKVKGSIFNYLSNKISFEMINVCDIYAGSGSLGFEALSRGAGLVDFIEKNFKVSMVIKENIDTLKVNSRCRIIRSEAVKFSKTTPQKKYDLILADPPFFKDDIHEVVRNLLNEEFLNEDGLLLVERSIQTEKKDIQEFEREPFKKIGDSLIYEFTPE
ncbi:MAG: 16S rRNA (guanine(966)-N(2))-methyltransferase RsmD [Ignavibacteriales bacterium]|nr:16S rRNA (guanine(966)-N(2))-methyltransferase RsmD [Ignavibacteriales bacterium]MCF8306368.1 16S rRNA (guanine(966)-N(2))-methyltransferase RsmD [Ignavibacteriales bacterium]MCF8435777.1 16S rRNA (guanine(966)-N(2))-methyltransferase RsmD [Ignavibacteriales bacterium]